MTAVVVKCCHERFNYSHTRIITPNLKALAEREGITANQFIASAVAEKMASVLTLNYLKSEAVQVKRGDFEAFLDAVPNVAVKLDTDKLG